MYYGNTSFDALKWKTIKSIEGLELGSEQVTFNCTDGSIYKMYHSQDCCESVEIEDITGDIASLLGYPIFLAEESSSDENPEGVKPEYQDSFTWTFYKLATIKGYIDIRWYGESNGYYSERVDFVEITPATIAKLYN